MQKLVEDTAQKIDDCGEVCSAYAKESVIAKFFKSTVWVTQLAGVGKVFDDRRTEFQFALTMHTAVGMDTANITLEYVKGTMTAMNERMEMMFNIIAHTLSREEQQLKEEAGSENIESILENETLLIRLAKDKLRGASSSATKRSKAEGKPYTLEDLRKDLRTAPKEAIEKNMEAFEQKLSLQKKHITAEMNAMADRVIKSLKAGPHDEIDDPAIDIRALWKRMDWRGSIKSRYFIMGLRDHFHEKWGSEVQAAKSGSEVQAVKSGSEVQGVTKRKVWQSSIKARNVVKGKRDHYQEKSGSEFQGAKRGSDEQGVKRGDASSSAGNPNADEWALAYLNIHWLQPIGESFDDDASGFITVGEIRDIFAKMFAILPRIDVSNQVSINKYLSYVYPNVTTILAAVNPCHVNEALQEKFQPYIESEEKRLRENLEMARYDIDDLDTLALITGPGRIGKYAHALFYLLLQRHFEIFRICQHRPVHPDELWDAAGSIGCVMKAFMERFELLKSVFRQRRLDLTEQLATFAHGMFKYLDNPDGLREAIRKDEFLDYSYDDKLESQDLKDVDILRFQVDQQLVDIDPYPPPPNPKPLEAASLASVLGTWNGFWYRNVLSTLPCRGMLSMTLHLPEEKQTLLFEGSSQSNLGKEQTLRFERSLRSNLGKFTLYGRCSQDAAANSFHFSMKRDLVSNHRTQYWDGQFDVATETITGTWGTDSDVSAHIGTFILKRTAPEDLRFRPAPATIEANKARSLWVYALNAVEARVRRQLWSWSHFKERRDNREEFITLYTRHGHLGRPLINRKELWRFRRVREKLTAADSRFYHSLADDRIRKTINHGVQCAKCHGTIGGTRIICLICQPNAWGTLDLCEDSECVAASIEQDSLPTPHLPTHDVIKVRCFVHMVHFGKLEREAVQALERVRVLLGTGDNASDLEEAYDNDYPSQVTQAAPDRASMKLGSSHHCTFCNVKITPPCWYYIHGEGDTFICDACETHDKARLMKQYEAIFKKQDEAGFKNQDDAYDLVRCQSLRPATAVALSTKERLGNLEERFLALDSKMDDRLGRVEELLNSMLKKVKE
ncbi:hypothetical protein JB92DRAFT_2930249 [Gautieria morchelliformis]|nr:hypothetical protein JB92DRAFT_2930249 [Gautieria morchelliformis]